MPEVRRRVTPVRVRQDGIFYNTPTYADTIFARTPRRCGAKKHLLAPNMFEKVYMDSSLAMSKDTINLVFDVIQVIHTILPVKKRYGLQNFKKRKY